jgi:hypothetical protein
MTCYTGPVTVILVDGTYAQAVASFVSRIAGTLRTWSGALQFDDETLVVQQPKLGHSLRIHLPSGRVGDVLFQYMVSPRLHRISVQGTGPAPF